MSDEQSQDTNSSKTVKDKYKMRGPVQSDTDQELLRYLREKEERRKQEREERDKRTGSKEQQRNDLLRDLISVLKE